MELRYLGTAAAEGWPGLFCQCDHCRRARQAGGRNLRSRSQAIVDEKLLIDFPPDTYLHVLQLGLDLTAVTDCLITHDHSDHLYAHDLAMRSGAFAHRFDKKALNLYATRPACTKIEAVLSQYNEPEGPAVCHLVKAFEPFSAGPYQVVPLLADHAPECEPVIYRISRADRTLLYAHDTGYFPEATWQYLADSGELLNLVSLDCTALQLDWRRGHMGLAACAEVRQRLFGLGLADSQTCFVINHFSHNGGLIHDELVPVAARLGFQVAYDGLTLPV
ncbi:MAG: MBL fold metallo-hydrolase [Clostridiales bacterium]|nr:MBL fold metallo-hydrolase [Clostridiales bacterium]